MDPLATKGLPSMAVILVVTRDEQFYRTLSGVLPSYRHDVVQVWTMAEAEHSLAGRQASMVVLDLESLGVAVFTQLRAQFPQVPLLAVGGDMSIELESQVREMGAADVLRKKLKLNVLTQVINRILQQAPKGESPAQIRTGAFPAAPALASKILIVDDEQDIRDMVGEFLRRRGYQVRTAGDGEEALRIVKSDHPDLVLLDVYMPIANGVKFLNKLQESGVSPAVIMLTACQDEHLLKTTLDLGAFEVLPKPVDLRQLELAVAAKLHA
jgi:DNA-binding response OmpR family regulator